MLLAVALAACVPPRGQAEPQHIRLLPDQVYTNKPTQFQFPPKVAEFRREAELTEFDPDGRQIGVGYDDLVHKSLVSVYVYPVEQRPPNDTLEGHFEAGKAKVLKRLTDAKLVAEGKVQVSPKGKNQEGLHATFTGTKIFAHNRQPVRSELYLFAHRGSFVLFLVTYPAGQQATVEPALKAFMNELAWP